MIFYYGFYYLAIDERWDLYFGVYIYYNNILITRFENWQYQMPRRVLNINIFFHSTTVTSNICIFDNKISAVTTMIFYNFNSTTKSTLSQCENGKNDYIILIPLGSPKTLIIPEILYHKYLLVILHKRYNIFYNNTIIKQHYQIFHSLYDYYITIV